LRAYGFVLGNVLEDQGRIDEEQFPSHALISVEAPIFDSSGTRGTAEN
jgi:hypothetical protein